MASERQDMEARASAAAWLARMRSDQRDVEDEIAFRQWLAADPAHAEAFEVMNQVWEVSGPPRRDLRGQPPKTDKGISRRAMFGGGVLLAGIGGTLALTEVAQANVYRTEIGEQKHVLLRDGTELFLDTDTEVVVDLDKKKRRADLNYGRANFRVAADKSRPFTLDVAGNIVVGAHYTFDARRDGEKVSVVLIEGRASVESAGRAAPRVMGGGDRLVSSAPHAAKFDKPNLLPLLAWHTGQAIFQNDTLIQAAYEMNRYSMLKLEVSDTRIENLKVSGIYRVGDNTMFALALQKLLPVSVRQFSDRIEIVGDEARLIQI
ncbi:MAG TPA: FecR domain-containing protein [Rhizomicrobium sp.]|jgi:transmembrane sensor